MAAPSPELAALFTPVLEWLDRGGDEQLGFNMTNFYQLGSADYAGTDCGTTCCIAGALSVFNKLDYGCLPSGLHTDYSAPAVAALYADDVLEASFGMVSSDVDALFYDAPKSTPPAKAAAVVRHWIATGEVNWNIPYAEPAENA